MTPSLLELLAKKLEKAIVCKCACEGRGGEHECCCLPNVIHRCYPPSASFQIQEKKECDPKDHVCQECGKVLEVAPWTYQFPAPPDKAVEDPTTKYIEECLTVTSVEEKIERIRKTIAIGFSDDFLWDKVDKELKELVALARRQK